MAKFYGDCRVRALLLRILMAYGRSRLKRFVSIAVGKRSTVRLDRVNRMPDCSVTIGQDCIIHARISFDRDGAAFRCGDRCYIGASHMVLAKEIHCGDDVVISWGVTVVDHNSHAIRWEDRANDIIEWGKGTKDWTKVKVDPVRIADKVWIGFNAIILKGVVIGEGAIVAAGAVVTKDVPPYSVVAGNPARVVRMQSDNKHG